MSIRVAIPIILAATKRAVEERAEKVMTDIFTELTSPPPEGTPVDTGFARQGWQLDLSNPMEPEITNEVPYIGSLAKGHSTQSPDGWIDRAIDKGLGK